MKILITGHKGFIGQNLTLYLQNEHELFGYEWQEDNLPEVEGFDWVNLFVEEERDEVMHEFHSCLEMNRRFNKTTKLQNGKEVRLLGYPYRISEHEHGGFLISITENEA